mmetsp:Transcript_24361/g.37727  ORF Transcript_24361/g.37727 Transcript_24361/m.37727 type:complete len:162 (-) Transcript_24361:268-753(-)
MFKYCLMKYVNGGVEEGCLPTCQKQTYSLIFMDLNMPIMDGFEASHSILSLQKEHIEAIPRKCEIIALSAYVNQTYIQRCMDIGMTKFMNKPAKAKDIGEQVATYCPFLNKHRQAGRKTGGTPLSHNRNSRPQRVPFVQIEDSNIKTTESVSQSHSNQLSN